MLYTRSFKVSTTTTQLNKKYWTGITLASFGHLKMNGLFLLECTFYVKALSVRAVSDPKFIIAI